VQQQQQQEQSLQLQLKERLVLVSSIACQTEFFIVASSACRCCCRLLLSTACSCNQMSAWCQSAGRSCPRGPLWSPTTAQQPFSQHKSVQTHPAVSADAFACILSAALTCMYYWC
jgi:hypothetical protein